MDHTYVAGQLTATPGAGQTFSGWSDACTGTAVTTTVTITGDRACTAWFSTHPQLTLTLAGSGSGHVATDPAGLSCDSTCTAGLTPGASVTLIVTPDPGSRFAGWSGDAGCADGAVTLKSMAVMRAEEESEPPMKSRPWRWRVGAFGEGSALTVRNRC